MKRFKAHWSVFKDRGNKHVGNGSNGPQRRLNGVNTLTKAHVERSVVERIFSITSLKWLLLLVALGVTAAMLLLFYRGSWGLGKWLDSSQRDLDGNLINLSAGPGQFRVNQLVITFLGGGALAFAGVLLQKITRNTLAEVSILGIGSINIMFIFAYILIFKDQFANSSNVQAFLPIVTLFASLLGTLLVWLVSRSKRANRNTFVIVGIALQLLFEAISVAFINPTTLSQTMQGRAIWGQIKKYSLGQVDSQNTPMWLLILAGLVIGAIITLALFLRKRIDIYESNPALAITLGIRLERLRLIVFVLVAVLAGIEASLLGAVALLGIVAPSIARRLFRNKFLSLSISAFLIGGILVMLGSFIEISVGAQLPTGILSTAITAPYFLYLIVRGK